ncbi:hypothetical protein [Bacillus sp. UMB0728]|uniref:hypothetical protein n=1 Tax=Bacillus sp. UMB0728 TaxID=2066052 RepID=UPI000C7573BE|nr:hypothetical protein [Bacillus sp. UMB0728]PLR70853.1 hypothetical protein CYJ37_22880 [Bacillus sp. UMB0728]
MDKFRGFYLIFIVLLTACTQHEVVPKENLQKKENDDNTIFTSDGQLTFKIFNNIKVPQEKVESIKEELLNAYDDIQDTFYSGYVPSERINVFLNAGNQDSWGLRSELKLYSVRENQYPLVHELTHSLLGYGDNDSSKGYLTQEGFATYMEDKHGKIKSHAHKIMKYFLDIDKTIPITKLLDQNQDDSFFRPALTKQEEYTLRWMSYLHSASFVTYLVDTYGLERFEKIYNKEDLGNKVEEVYGKKVNEIENDWKTFIKDSQTELTYNEKLEMKYFYTYTSAIDEIDPKFFTR